MAFVDDNELISKILPAIKFDQEGDGRISARAYSLIGKIRAEKVFSIERFLNKYDIQSTEGLALIALSEALIRIPDDDTALALLNDKLRQRHWDKYLELPTWDLLSWSGYSVYAASMVANFYNFTKFNFGKGYFLKLAKKVIKFAGDQFILGGYIADAVNRSKKLDQYKFSFDLLGESARNFDQAHLYYQRYLTAIDILKVSFPDSGQPLTERPNLSIKLTALYPYVRLTHEDEIQEYLIPRLINLIRLAKEAKISISFDAEEANRWDIYKDIVSQLVVHREFKDFDGIGFVVQAYQKRARMLLEHIVILARKIGKQIPVRLVKGAYWDSEIKRAQEDILENYPVFIRKEFTDANYVACAKYMLEQYSSLYPQFATHNAVTAATIIEMAGDKKFEFQKLYGMGNILHAELVKNHSVRIYAPVGQMHDLLAYLMRRMLENGANSSFVHQVMNKDSELLTANLHDIVADRVKDFEQNRQLPLPKFMFKNFQLTTGFDLGYKMHKELLEKEVSRFFNKTYQGFSIINGKEIGGSTKKRVRPANLNDEIGAVHYVKNEELVDALNGAVAGWKEWDGFGVAARAAILRKIADLYEENQYELFALLLREGGKTIKDAVGELQEAVEFCRYYATQAELLMADRVMPGVTGERNILSFEARGVFLCIAPWNFPLAIFTGQIVAALVTGNAVIAKPADQTSIIANYIVKLMHKAGVPKNILHLTIAHGSEISQTIITSKKLDGVSFTGSTVTAQNINLTLAQRGGAIVPLIAETGGQNAMIVDSSALIEQVVDDVIISAFYTAGQRCSALRILYLQEEIYDDIKTMLVNCCKNLKIGDNLDFNQDIGPVIDAKAKEELEAHVQSMQERGFKLITEEVIEKKGGHFFYPKILEVSGINDIPDEKFGPILHIAKYKAKDLDKVIDEINNYGFGLTFGVQSRIESKIEYLRSRIRAGNIYANRTIVGARVGSQPFGGMGLSGTGFKAGGPNYLLRFMTEKSLCNNITAMGGNVEIL